MEKELTYNLAFAELETLVDQLEEGGVELEELPAKIKQANELIKICEMKLRKTSDEAEDAIKKTINLPDK